MNKPGELDTVKEGVAGGDPVPRRPRPKVRSRRDGAAIPLDQTDKRLMNLLQSSFPLQPEPFEKVAAEAGLGVDEVKARTQRLLDERIIREITPIFDTRALGYSSMLVAAKVDPEAYVRRILYSRFVDGWRRRRPWELPWASPPDAAGGDETGVATDRITLGATDIVFGRKSAIRDRSSESL